MMFVTLLMNLLNEPNELGKTGCYRTGVEMKYENRRYNKNETSKEFYLRRKQEMSEILESDAYKKWYKKIWAEYKEKNSKLV